MAPTGVESGIFLHSSELSSVIFTRFHVWVKDRDDVTLYLTERHPAEKQGLKRPMRLSTTSTDGTRTAASLSLLACMLRSGHGHLLLPNQAHQASADALLTSEFSFIQPRCRDMKHTFCILSEELLGYKEEAGLSLYRSNFQQKV